MACERSLLLKTNIGMLKINIFKYSFAAGHRVRINLLGAPGLGHLVRDTFSLGRRLRGNLVRNLVNHIRGTFITTF